MPQLPTENPDFAHVGLSWGTVLPKGSGPARFLKAETCTHNERLSQFLSLFWLICPWHFSDKSAGSLVKYLHVPWFTDNSSSTSIVIIHRGTTIVCILKWKMSFINHHVNNKNFETPKSLISPYIVPYCILLRVHILCHSVFTDYTFFKCLITLVR